MDCFDVGMIHIILPIVLYLSILGMSKLAVFFLSLIIVSFSFKIMSLPYLLLLCKKGQKVEQNLRRFSVLAHFFVKCCFIAFC